MGAKPPREGARRPASDFKMKPRPSRHNPGDSCVPQAPVEVPAWHLELPLRWPRITFAKPAIIHLDHPLQRAANLIMEKRSPTTPSDSFESRIVTIRGQRVILDADLAAIYGVTTK